MKISPPQEISRIKIHSSELLFKKIKNIRKTWFMENFKDNKIWMKALILVKSGCKYLHDSKSSGLPTFDVLVTSLS